MGLDDTNPAKSGIETYEDQPVDEKAIGAGHLADAIEAENAEHQMTVLGAVHAYPMACFWAFVFSFTIIMESFCVFLIGNFLALDAFIISMQGPGYTTTDSAGALVVVTKWQSSLQVSGQLGALIGVFLAGPITSRIGYRWATFGGLMLLNVFIFVFYYAKSIPVVFASQILEGIPWGIFIANAPAYCSEIVPIKLRAPCTQMLQMFWAIGSIIVGAVTYVYADNLTPEAWRIPVAVQWMFPTPLAILVYCAPESPWWLARRGRREEAKHSVERLGRRSLVNSEETVAMMERTISIEKNATKPKYIELFQGTDRRRTLIVCGVYAAQNLTGNLIANQAVYFFTQAGVGSRLAFALGLITSALQMIMVMISWVLTTYFGRRQIYLWGSAVNTFLLIMLGIAGSVKRYSKHSEYAQASLGLVVSVLFTLGPAPASWVYIGETSAIRLRPMTTGIGRASYYIIELPCIFLASYMLNPTGGDLGAKCGYVWGATGFCCLVTAYFFLPEMKGRSYREIDILFHRTDISPRKWPEVVIDIKDEE